jgi:hypothetical protein
MGLTQRYRQTTGPPDPPLNGYIIEAAWGQKGDTGFLQVSLIDQVQKGRRSLA